MISEFEKKWINRSDVLEILESRICYFETIIAALWKLVLSTKLYILLGGPNKECIVKRRGGVLVRSCSGVFLILMVELSCVVDHSFHYVCFGPKSWEFRAVFFHNDLPDQWWWLNSCSTDHNLPCYSLKTGFLCYFGEKLLKKKKKTKNIQTSSFSEK